MGRNPRVDRARARRRRLPASLGARLAWAGVLSLSLAPGCKAKPAENRARASGYVEATEVRIASEVGGRLLQLRVSEGDRVVAGSVVAVLDTGEIELTLARARAERAQAEAQVRLVHAAPRQEDVRQAEAQVSVADAELGGARAELTSAEQDLERYELLLRSSSGSRKQRDDAATRRDVARERARGASDRVRGARAAAARVKAGARPQEVDVAQARVAVVDAQIASLEKSVRDATVRAPGSGIVTQTLADVGELLAPRAPIALLSDLDRAWVNVFVDEPVVPRLELGQAASIATDAGGAPLPGILTFISPKAEFTPRNVQTAEERSTLVYRLKVTTDNRKGILKQGMPVDVELPLQDR